MTRRAESMESTGKLTVEQTQRRGETTNFLPQADIPGILPNKTKVLSNAEKSSVPDSKKFVKSITASKEKIADGSRLASYNNPSTDRSKIYSNLNNNGRESAIAPVVQTTHVEYKTACSEKRHVAFIKVHKAASTTVMNMMLRFAVARNLSIAMPRTGNYLGMSLLQRDRLLPLPQGSHFYDILCNHVSFSREIFQSIMAPDSVNIGILRHPWSHFVSSLLYYKVRWNLHYLQKLPGPPYIPTYLQNPSYYEAGMTDSYTDNRMSFDFGVPYTQFKNETFIRNYVQQLDKDFTFVMIMERFDESAILLKRMLCWGLKDILYVHLNDLGSYNETDVLTTEHMQKHKLLARPDYLLYEHFYARYARQIQAQGTSFTEEVQYFKNLRMRVKELCRQYPAPWRDSRDEDHVIIMHEPTSRWGRGFTLSVSECRFLQTEEFPLIDDVRAWRLRLDQALILNNQKNVAGQRG